MSAVKTRTNVNLTVQRLGPNKRYSTKSHHALMHAKTPPVQEVRPWAQTRHTPRHATRSLIWEVRLQRPSQQLPTGTHFVWILITAKSESWRSWCFHQSILNVKQSKNLVIYIHTVYLVFNDFILLKISWEGGFVSRGALDSSPSTVEYVPALQRMQAEEFVAPVIFKI